MDEAETAAKKAAAQEAKKKQVQELNSALDEMMEKKRLDNQEVLTRAQAKRGMAGIQAYFHARRRAHTPHALTTTTTSTFLGAHTFSRHNC